MLSFEFDYEIARLAIIVGVVIGILIYNRFGITAGGAIVPGYLALSMVEPSHIVATFCITFTTYYIVNSWLRPRYMLAGSRLFETELIVAFVLQFIWTGMLTLIMQEMPSSNILTTIGFVLPGIIAHDMGRQGFVRTSQVTLASTVIVFVVITAVASIQAYFDIPTMTFDEQLPMDESRIFMAIGLSLVVVMLIRFSPLKNAVRTGGFISAGYLALTLQNPIDLLIIFGTAVVTYLIVTQYLMDQAIIFGRSKIAIMILTGMILTWLIEFWSQTLFGYTPWPGIYIIAPMIIALLANDSQRSGMVPTFGGTALAVTAVFFGLQIMPVF